MENKEALIEKIKIAYKILYKRAKYDAHKYIRYGYNLSFWQDIAGHSVAKAWETYDAKKGKKFENWASFLYDRAQSNVKKKINSLKSLNISFRSLDEPTNPNNPDSVIIGEAILKGNPLNELEHLLPIEEQYFIKEQEQIIKNSIPKLRNQRNKDIFCKYIASLLSGKDKITQSDISKEFNVSRSRISQILKETLQEMRQLIEKEYN